MRTRLSNPFFLIFVLSCVIYLKSFGQRPDLDSLKNALNVKMHDTSRASLLNSIATIYSQKSDTENCNRFVNEVFMLVEKSTPAENNIRKKLRFEKAYGLNLQGISAYQTGNYGAAIDKYTLSFQEFSAIGHQKKAATELSNIGVAYYAQSNYPKALDYYLRSMKIREKLADKDGLSACISNIGIVYDVLGDYNKAIEYHQKALDLVVQIGNRSAQANYLNNLGRVYWHKNDLRNATAHIAKALTLFDSVGDLSGKTTALSNLGVIYSEQKEFGKALDYCSQALEINNAIGNKRGIAITKNNLGNICYQQKQYAKAIPFFSQALQTATVIGMLDLVREAEFNLYNCYDQLHDSKNALLHFKRFTQAKDSLFNEEKNEKILELQNNFEIERREQRINLLEKNKIIREMELDKKQQEIVLQKRSSALLIAFCILLLLFLTVLVIVYIKKIKTSRLLASKNEEIHRQKIADLLKEQNLRAIQQLVRGQETERQRIAKDLHDGVGGTLAGIKLKLLKLEDSLGDPEQIKALTRNIETAYDEIRTISHNLTPPQLQQTVFTDAIQQLVNEMETSSHLKIKLECVSPAELNALHENIQIEIYRILQELLKNVLVHANATEVLVDLIKSENDLTLLVEDNGKGYIAPVKISGIGLHNIKHRVESLNGKFSIDSQLSRGTAVNINIAC